ncbi:MAG: hypothetical protein PHF37_01850 [Phycisphaerae bacterium]|nr:hypothetical protein [Phycisphaerae bacterium]
MYYKEVNIEKRGEMTAFLKKHLKYHTANSWNNSTSYANNIKLYNIDKPPDISDDIWWQMFELAQWQEKLSDLLEEFGRRHNWLWQAGINGRSGGYIILYRGGIRESGYKSYCTHCGQKNYQVAAEGQVGICGRCEAKARVNFKQTHMQVFTWSGREIDMCENFRNWSLTELRERVELVQNFDKLSDEIAAKYISLCRNYRITEEEILVPKTIKVLEPIGG